MTVRLVGVAGEVGHDALDPWTGRCNSRGVTVSIYTSELFRRGNDADNRAAVASVPTDALDLVGLAVYAPRKDVDRIIKGLKLHP